MFRKPIFIAILVLALASMACSISINLPVTQVKTGPTETEEINVPLPADSGTVTDLTLSFGAGTFDLAPGADNALVSGTATYNVMDFKPKTTINGNSVQIKTGNLEINGIPSFRGNQKNAWDLKLGDTPLQLTINAGAYKGNFELGGLALKYLKIGDGASDVKVNFSEANKVEMNSLRYETGASTVSLSGLANANFSSMTFKGGAGTYTLDFSGELQRDADVSIESGVSTVTVSVPEGVSARLSFKGGLTNVHTRGSWEQSGRDYVQSGSGPTITFHVNMGVGNLELTNQP
jgi:hypothetical protein